MNACMYSRPVYKAENLPVRGYFRATSLTYWHRQGHKTNPALTLSLPALFTSFTVFRITALNFKKNHTEASEEMGQFI